MAAWVPVHRRCACFRLRCVWGQEPTRGEARSQVKLKRDASATLLSWGAIGVLTRAWCLLGDCSWQCRPLMTHDLDYKSQWQQQKSLEDAHACGDDKNTFYFATGATEGPNPRCLPGTSTIQLIPADSSFIPIPKNIFHTRYLHYS